MTSIKTVISLIASTLFLPCLFAGETGDKRDTGFNATDYSLQKRYVPEGEEFASSSFIDNCFISPFIGTGSLYKKDNRSFTRTLSIGASAGKWFDKYFGMRGTLSYENFHSSRLTSVYHTYGADLSALFNLSSYICGYSRSRLFDVYALAGIGMDALAEGSMRGADKGSVSGNLHLGLNAALRATKYFDVFVEPDVYLNTGTLRTGLSDYSISYAVRFGISYPFQPRGTSRKTTGFMENAFVSASFGTMFQNSSLVHETVGFPEALGMHLNLSFGKMYQSYVGLRATVFYTENTWGHYASEYLKGEYFGARLEGIYDFSGISGLSERRFAVLMLLGPEVGMLNKSDISGKVRHPYIGVTGGIQARCDLSRRFSLFVEPRFSVAPYSHPDGYGNRPSYYDLLLGGNFGIAVKL